MYWKGKKNTHTHKGALPKKMQDVSSKNIGTLDISQEATEESKANLVSAQCAFRVDNIFNSSGLTTCLHYHRGTVVFT